MDYKSSHQSSVWTCAFVSTLSALSSNPNGSFVSKYYTSHPSVLICSTPSVRKLTNSGHNCARWHQAHRKQLSVNIRAKYTSLVEGDIESPVFRMDEAHPLSSTWLFSNSTLDEGWSYLRPEIVTPASNVPVLASVVSPDMIPCRDRTEAGKSLHMNKINDSHFVVRGHCTRPRYATRKSPQCCPVAPEFQQTKHLTRGCGS